MKQLKVVFSLLLVALLLAGCGTKDTKNVDAAKDVYKRQTPEEPIKAQV